MSSVIQGLIEVLEADSVNSTLAHSTQSLKTLLSWDIDTNKKITALHRPSVLSPPAIHLTEVDDKTDRNAPGYIEGKAFATIVQITISANTAAQSKNIRNRVQDWILYKKDETTITGLKYLRLIDRLYKYDDSGKIYQGILRYRVRIIEN